MIQAKTQAALAGVSTLSVASTDYAAKGYHLEVQVTAEQLVAAVEVLDREGFFIEAITGADLLTFDAAEKKPAKKAKAADAETGEAAAPPPPPPKPAPPQMEVFYDFDHTDELCRVLIRSKIPRATPEIPSISSIYAGADWHERETHDFFGIKFVGHPCLKPLLLPEDADFHPLLKDFKA
ncbi:MAG: hypothetical protein A2521_12905 [Deltaproteobacteria bacterium RIFOXYD12_FULL_57_12]|nr:MAG: hypothetical protein A2521_12905 [Deltaproteobacteria bacterium RIFOXYD12_FULL_57_12]